MRLYHLVAIGISCFLLFPQASPGLHAATLNLDAAGGVQPWDYITPNWLDQDGLPSAWIDGSDAWFIGTAGTVSIANTIDSVNSLTFATSNYIISGGTITITGLGGWIDTQIAGANTINSVIAGSVDLLKTGSGTLTLGGANTYTGNTVIFQGTLKLANAYALQYSTLDYNYGGLLSFGAIASPTFGGLSGNNSLSLVNDVSEFVALTVGGNGQSTTYNGNIVGVQGSSLKKVGSGTLTIGGSINCDTKISGGTLALSSPTVLQNSTVELDGGALSFGASFFAALGGLKGSGNLAQDNLALEVGHNNQSTSYGGVLSGTMMLAKSGAGTLTLNGENTFSGNTYIDGGTLKLGTPLALQNSTFDTSGNGALRFGSLTSATLGGLYGNHSLTLMNDSFAPVALTVGGNNQSTTYQGSIVGPTGSSLKKVGSGTLTWDGPTYCDTVVVSGGTLALSAPAALENSTVELDGGALSFSVSPFAALGGLKGSGNLAQDNLALEVGHNNQSTSYGGVLSGTMMLAKSGAGTLTLNGENTFSGITYIDSGILKLGTPLALQNSTLDTSGNGVLRFGSLTSATLGGLYGNHSLTLMNDSFAPVALTVGGNNQSTTYQGSIVGPTGSSLKKVGSGTLTWDGPSYCDTIIIGGGTLALSAPTVLENSTVELDGGALSFGASFFAALGGLKGSGNLAQDNLALEVGHNNQSTSYGGVLSGTMMLAKSGAGTLTLNGENTFSGNTYIDGGTLKLGTPLALQNSTLDTSGYGALQFGSLTSATVGGLYGNHSLTLMNDSFAPVALTVGGNNQSTTYQGSIVGPMGSSLKKVGSGTLTWDGPSYCDTIIISGGTLALSTPTVLENSTVELDGGALSFGASFFAALGGLKGSGNLAQDNLALEVGHNNQSTSYGGVLSGTMMLVKSGAGTLTLNGENTFSGNTYIDSGILKLGTPLALQNSTLDTSGYGALQFGSLTSATLGGLYGNHSLPLMNDTFGPVALSVGNNNTSTTYTGALSGPGSITKTGSGTLTLAGANDYAGTTILKSGTLVLTPAAYNTALTLGGVDLQAGKLVFDYSGISDPAGAIAALLTASCNGGLWNVGQLMSSTALPAGLTLGCYDDAAAHTVTVMPTYAGDFNLDGVVNDLDMDVWKANFGAGNGWQQGDVNYDGNVNGLDLDCWKLNVGKPPIAGGGSSILVGPAVPEPGTLSLLAAGLIGLLAYVWRNRN